MPHAVVMSHLVLSPIFCFYNINMQRNFVKGQEMIRLELKKANRGSGKTIVGGERRGLHLGGSYLSAWLF